MANLEFVPGMFQWDNNHLGWLTKTVFIVICIPARRSLGEGRVIFIKTWQNQLCTKSTKKPRRQASLPLTKRQHPPSPRRELPHSKETLNIPCELISQPPNSVRLSAQRAGLPRFECEIFRTVQGLLRWKTSLDNCE